MNRRKIGSKIKKANERVPASVASLCCAAGETEGRKDRGGSEEGERDRAVG